MERDIGLEIMENPDAEEVEMGEWLDARRPEKLFTTGLGPCAGVLVHNPKRGLAALGHFVDPSFDVEGFYGMAKFARKEMGGILDQVVYLSGVAPEDMKRKNVREMEEIRKFVIRAFRDLGYKKTQIKRLWNGLDEYSNMAVDTESGKVDVSRFGYGHLVGIGDDEFDNG